MSEISLEDVKATAARLSPWAHMATAGRRGVRRRADPGAGPAGRRDALIAAVAGGLIQRTAAWQGQVAR